MTGEEFENEVRNVARALWQSAPGDGAPEMVKGRERDCVFRDEYLIHYIECTKKRDLKKLQDDSRKMVQFRDHHSKNGTPVKLWFVTYHEPTGEQRTFGRDNGIEVLSLQELRRKIMDAQAYLEARLNYPFGSAVDPKTDSADISSVKYEPVAIRHDKSHEQKDPDDIANNLIASTVVALLGDYGMGKSITIREIFLRLRRRYFNTNGDTPIPVTLNLREHWGQKSPAEVLIRHAENVGLENPYQLVRALHAGRLIVLLDGFDELGSQAWATHATSRLKELRASAVKLVKEFVRHCRGKSGILVAGREHYFDSRKELTSALGIRDSDETYRLDEFSDREAKAFLRKQGVMHELPEWLPKRPVLLASLVGRDLLDAVIQSSETSDPSTGWNKLIELICEREAAIHELLDAESIRGILEAIASRSRATQSGIGPITEDHLAEAYRSKIGSYPDNPARILLQRLPGLSARNSQDGSRSFLDDQLLDVLRAGDVFRAVINPWQEPHAADWMHGLGELAAGVVYGMCWQSGKQKHGEFVSAAKQAIERWDAPTLGTDIVLAEWFGIEEAAKLDWEGLFIQGADIKVLDFSVSAEVTRLALGDCSIDILVAPDAPPAGVELRDCVIKNASGYSKQESIPKWMPGCDITNYDERESNAELLRNETLGLSLRVLGTILRKLFLQSGHGRKENALYRGLGKDARGRVKEVLEVLRKNRMVYQTSRKGVDIWHPVTNQRARAIEIIDRLQDSEDQVVVEARKLR